jgi:hypothetical protein
MNATRKYLAGTAIVAWTLPLLGIFDSLLKNFPPEAQAVLLLIYISTFVMLIPLRALSPERIFPGTVVALAFLVFGLLYCLYPLLKGTAATDLFQGTDGHVYPISMMSLYAVGGLYLLGLRIVLNAWRSAAGANGAMPVNTERK